MTETFDKQKAFSTPEAVFKTPDDVILCDQLTTQEKITVLTNWKDQYIQFQHATEEGMEPSQPKKLLTDVSNSLEKIKN